VLLSHFHVQDEHDIRESSATLGLTERKLIQEIRQETNRQISEKEREISVILSKLYEVDAEYRTLHESVENLTEAQRERAASLLMMQNDFRGTLSDLYDERAQIIEDSRMREAMLKAQADKRAEELSSQIEQSQAHLGAAMDEIRRLSTEQERVARVESQMAGYYAAASNMIAQDRLDEAYDTLRAMKEFLDAPSLQGMRSLETRKQTNLAAIAAMEGAVAEAQRQKDAASREAGAVRTVVSAAGQDEALAELQERYAALEKQVEDQGRLIAASSAEGSEQGRMIAEYANSINELRTQNERFSAANINQQETLNRRDSEIVTLRTETAALSSQLQTANTRIQQSEAELEEQRRQNTALTQQNNELQGRYEDLQRRMDAAVRAFTGE